MLLLIYRYFLDNDIFNYFSKIFQKLHLLTIGIKIFIYKAKLKGIYRVFGNPIDKFSEIVGGTIRITFCK